MFYHVLCGRVKVKCILVWEGVCCIKMGMLLVMKIWESYLEESFVTSNINCTVVLVVIIMYFVVISMIIFTIINFFKCFIVPDGINNM